MINRRHASPLIFSRLTDGVLSASEQARWQAHLVDCKDCREKARAFLRVKAALRNLPPVEENPLQQLQPPIFVPVARPVFPVWGFMAGVAAGMLLIAGWLAFRPARLPMRLVSASEELAPGAALNVPDRPVPGDIDLEIPNQLLLRLKPGTTVTWQEMDRLRFFGGRPNIVLNVMRGQVLARTEEHFWGSKLQIRTPTANATVKGTAFSVAVDPKESATRLKVLAGSVFFSPYLDPVGIHVGAGEEGLIQGKHLSGKPRLLSVDEKKQLMETYRIGQAPIASLVIGAGPERLEELLQPAQLFIRLQPHPQMQPYLVTMARDLNAAILDGNLASSLRTLRNLEGALQEVTDPPLAAPLRMYVGACNARLGYWGQASSHFRWVSGSCADHPLAPLALAAQAAMAWRHLNDPETATACFERIVSRYPASPEAPQARQDLKSLRSKRTRGI